MKSRLLLSTFLLLISIINLKAQPEFWGMTYNGGDGAIYKTDGNAENLSVELEFEYYYSRIKNPSSAKF